MIKRLTPRERALWRKHNLETLREWRAIPFTKKIRMIEELEKLARSMHKGELPQDPSTRKTGRRIDGK